MAEKDKKKKSAPDAAEKQQKETKKPSWLKRTLKVTAWIFGSLLFIIILALIFRDPLIKLGVTKVGSWVTGVELTLDSVDTSLCNGTVNIKGLRIANPEGYDNPYMLELGEFNLDIDNSSLFTDEIVIDDLVVKDLTFTAEFSSDNRFNVTQLTDDLKQRFPPAPEAEADDNAEKTEVQNTADNTNKKALLITGL